MTSSSSWAPSSHQDIIYPRVLMLTYDTTHVRRRQVLEQSYTRLNPDITHTDHTAKSDIAYQLELDYALCFACIEAESLLASLTKKTVDNVIRYCQICNITALNSINYQGRDRSDLRVLYTTSTEIQSVCQFTSTRHSCVTSVNKSVYVRRRIRILDLEVDRFWFFQTDTAIDNIGQLVFTG